MNIFKVLASGKKSFQEETASAMLTWLLNPEMEHGLGFTFLSKFLDTITHNDTEFNEISGKLTPKLRGEFEKKTEIWFELEYNVGKAIDIIIGLENQIIAIENKIYKTSVNDGQLQAQYAGLKKRIQDDEKLRNKKIGLVYLVPIGKDDDIHESKIDKEFESLSIEESEGDFKALITWQNNKIDSAKSISAILSQILTEENEGKIDPIPEYTRHTLKALLSFISNDFGGYDYERGSSISGLNPLAEKERLNYDELKHKNGIFVGVKGGIKGLLQMQPNELRNYRFQYSKQDMTNKRNWMHVNEFKNLASWRLGDYKSGKPPYIEWQGKFPADILYKISNDYGSNVFIGIQGGENALNSMNSSDIRNKEWKVGTEKANYQWIPGDKFKDILEKKQVF